MFHHDVDCEPLLDSAAAGAAVDPADVLQGRAASGRTHEEARLRRDDPGRTPSIAMHRSPRHRLASTARPSGSC